ncbi:MAG: glutamate--tRNA ligase [Metamycoplasmataceae bacterium]
MINRRIRTRYAPSPTGYLHIGGARTALFSYLLAKHYNGDFIVRIEDTDFSRNVERGEESQLENLAWLGIIPDEEPSRPNLKYGKYRQSEKIDRYNQIIDQMIIDGFAYKAYENKEELEKQKKEQEEKGIPSFRYDKNWLKISDEEKKRREKNNEFSIRVSIPLNKEYKWNDLVRGEISFNSNDIGDFVIKKSDGFPTYNFAVVIDDIDMEISHVLRGEEHIANTPKQLAIYEILKKDKPFFGHLTIITNMEGKKLSKRDLSLKQFIEDYRLTGYIPEAIFNFLSLLGWTPGNNQEILSKEELIKYFDVARLSKSPSKFDIGKMNWFSKTYMKNLDNYFIEKKLSFPANKSEEWKEVFISTFKQFSTTFSEMQIYLEEYNKGTNKINNEYKDNVAVVSFKEIFKDKIFTIDNIQETINLVGEKNKLKGKNLFMPIRLFLTDKTEGPELAKCIYLYGEEKIKERLKNI